MMCEKPQNFWWLPCRKISGFWCNFQAQKHNYIAFNAGKRRKSIKSTLSYTCALGIHMYHVCLVHNKEHVLNVVAQYSIKSSSIGVTEIKIIIGIFYFMTSSVFLYINSLTITLNSTSFRYVFVQNSAALSFYQLSLASVTAGTVEQFICKFHSKSIEAEENPQCLSKPRDPLLTT